MIWQDIAIIAAGFIGASGALIHSYLVRQKITAPLAGKVLSNGDYPEALARLVPALLDFSGFNWLIGGLALMAAPFWLGEQGLTVLALMVGSSYLYAAIGNCWGTRGRHPGWVIYGLATALLAAGAIAPRL